MAVTIYLSLVFLLLYGAGLVIRRYVFVRNRRRMLNETGEHGRRIARVEELPPGGVKKFWLICRKYRVDAFLVNHQGNFYAYINRCRHMATPLDFLRGQFLSEDRSHLMCYTHGALYEPATGMCVAGPCKGESLFPLPVHVEHGDVLVGCPEGDLSYLKE